MPIELTVNGRAMALEVPPDRLLADALREALGLTGTRLGCGKEQCGACLVLVDGTPAHACGREVGMLAGRAIVTAEGVPAAVREAFLAEQAGQCGFCLSGMMVAAAGLLGRNPRPDRAAVVAALDGNLCRCGAHPRIVAAVLRAAEAVS